MLLSANIFVFSLFLSMIVVYPSCLWLFPHFSDDNDIFKRNFINIISLEHFRAKVTILEIDWWTNPIFREYGKVFIFGML